MKIRTIYFKIPDMPAASEFWQKVLQIKPHKTFDTWHEFMCGDIRLGLLLNNFGDKFSGSNCVPVFEFDDTVLQSYIDRAKSAGAAVLVDGLDNPKLRSLVMADPWGNQFELSKFHD